MANQSQRGGMKQTKSQTGSEQKHQGIHPGSTTQSDAKNEKQTGSRNTPGADPHEGERVIPKKDRYDSDEG